MCDDASCTLCRGYNTIQRNTVALLFAPKPKTYFTWRVDNEDVNEELHAKPRGPTDRMSDDDERAGKRRSLKGVAKGIIAGARLAAGPKFLEKNHEKGTLFPWHKRQQGGTC